MRITLCEFASTNKDGTYTVIKGGIENWTTPSLPLQIRIYAFVEINSNDLDLALETHTARLSVLSPGGSAVAEGELQFKVFGNPSVLRFPVSLDLQFSQSGMHSVTARAGSSHATVLLDMRIGPG